MATISETTVRTILTNPSLTAKAQLALVQKVHPNKSSKECIAWYRVHIKKQIAGVDNKLGKDLRAIVDGSGNKDQLELSL